MTLFELDVDLGNLGQCDSLDWSKSTKEVGASCIDLCSHSFHPTGASNLKPRYVVIRALLAADKIIHLLLAHVIPARSAT